MKSVRKPIIDKASQRDYPIIIIGGPKQLDQKLDKNYSQPLSGRQWRSKREPKREINKSNLNEEIINDVLQYFSGHSSLVYVVTALLLIYFADKSYSRSNQEFDRNFLHLILGIFSALMALTLFLYAWLKYSSFFLPYLICLCIHTFLLLYRTAKTAYHYYEYHDLDVWAVYWELTLLVYNLLCAIFATKLYKQFEILERITATEPESIRLGRHVYQSDRTDDRLVYRLKDSVVRVDVKSEEAVDLLDLANCYLEEELKNECNKIIKTNISIENVCQIFSASLKYNCEELADYCADFASNKLKKICKTEDYKSMDGESLKQLIYKMHK